MSVSRTAPEPSPRYRLMDYETTALIRETADTAAKEAVDRTLLTMGINPKDPITMQRRMAALEEVVLLVSDPEFEADLAAVRSWRKTMSQVRSRGLGTAVGVVVVGLLAMLALGFKVKLGG